MKWLKASLFALSLGLFSLSAFAGPVDINSADANTLAKQLNGVGPKTAAAIVEYRTKHGAFKSVDDLLKVKGVGPKTLEKNRTNLTVGSVAAAAPAPAQTKAAEKTK